MPDGCLIEPGDASIGMRELQCRADRGRPFVGSIGLNQSCVTDFDALLPAEHLGSRSYARLIDVVGE